MLRGSELATTLNVRDEFAKAAMQGFLAGASSDDLDGLSGVQIPLMVADFAYQVADAMLARANGATATPSRLPEERP